MTDTDVLIEQLLTQEVHPFVLISEAADKYVPMIDSLNVVLANGHHAKVTAVEPDIAQKVQETRKTLRREDRVVWALRHYKKALVMELLWLVQNEPQFFQRHFGSGPAPQQPELERQLQKLGDVDITPFEEHDPNEPGATEPPYMGYATIDAINARLGKYIKTAETYGATEPDNLINQLVFQRQHYGEIVSMFRRAEVMLLKRYASVLHIWPQRSHEGEIEPNEDIGYRPPGRPTDLADKEGQVETLIEFPNGWKWLDLHRNCSFMRDDMISKKTAPGQEITGHCCNVASKGDCTVLELVEPLGKNRWKHHAAFILYPKGTLGERKGRHNQKPSPRLWKYIIELLKIRLIKNLGSGKGGYGGGANDFQLDDLPNRLTHELKKARPDLYGAMDEPLVPEA